jgi:hypothetical protein
VNRLPISCNFIFQELGSLGDGILSLCEINNTNTVTNGIHVILHAGVKHGALSPKMHSRLEHFFVLQEIGISHIGRA